MVIHTNETDAKRARYRWRAYSIDIAVLISTRRPYGSHSNVPGVAGNVRSLSLCDGDIFNAQRKPILSLCHFRILSHRLMHTMNEIVSLKFCSSIHDASSPMRGVTSPNRNLSGMYE